MGVIKNGITGGFQKKVGNVVGSTWKGISYMKSRPISVKNPRTAGQVAQRLKMTTLVALCQTILGSWIQPLCNKAAVKMSGYNWFVMHNIPAISNSGVVDETAFVPCNGPIAATPISAAVNAAGTVTVTFPTTLDGELQSANDIAYALVISPAMKKGFATHGALRSTGTIVVTLPTDMVADATNSEVYLAFKSNEPLIRPIAVSDYSKLAIS